MGKLVYPIAFYCHRNRPVFVKLIGSKGPYDDLLYTHEHGFDMYRVEQTTKSSHDTAVRLTDHTKEKKNHELTSELDPVAFVSRT